MNASVRDLVALAVLKKGPVPVIGSIVGGAAVAGDDTEYRRVSPAVGADCFVAQPLSAEQLETAVTTARTEFDRGGWGRATGRERGSVLVQTARLLGQNADAFAQLIVLETGKPLREARGEVAAAINAFEYFGGLARDLGGRTVRDLDLGVFALTLREPAGVAGLIVPWNFPLAILAQKAPPALAAGCAVIIKPSPWTPLSALAIAGLLLEAGAPAGSVTVAIGGAEIGSMLVSHPAVDVLSFTGSTATARTISAQAGQYRLKRVALEAGGKTPVIVTADADLATAIDGILFSSFFNQGEVCVAGSRVLVDARVSKEFTAAYVARAEAIQLGDPYDEATEMGPLVAAQHFERVTSMLQKATDAGAEVLTGGAEARPHHTLARPFLQPTVVSTADDQNFAVQEEIFGPVSVVQPFDSFEQAIARANASRYGLAASVWTSNVNTAIEAMLSLRVGTVWVNGSTTAFPEVPLGGRMDSGHDPEFGREGMEFFTNLKTVQFTRGRSVAWYRDRVGQGPAANSLARDRSSRLPAGPVTVVHSSGESA